MTELEKKLLAMLEEERAKNDVLTHLLLERSGYQVGDTTVSVSGTKSSGRSSWAVLKAKLEKQFRRSTDEIQDAQPNESSHYGDDTQGDD